MVTLLGNLNIQTGNTSDLHAGTFPGLAPSRACVCPTVSTTLEQHMTSRMSKGLPWSCSIMPCHIQGALGASRGQCTQRNNHRYDQWQPFVPEFVVVFVGSLKSHLVVIFGFHILYVVMLWHVWLYGCWALYLTYTFTRAGAWHKKISCSPSIWSEWVSVIKV